MRSSASAAIRSHGFSGHGRPDLSGGLRKLLFKLLVKFILILSKQKRTTDCVLDKLQF